MLPMQPEYQISRETEKKRCLIIVRNMGLKIHSPLGPGVLRVKERNIKETFVFLSFREDKQVN